MFTFIVFFIMFYVITILEFDAYLKPALSKMSSNTVKYPSKLIEGWLLVTASLFPLNSVLMARRSGFQLKQSMSFLALILGVILGMIVDVN
ncbi:FirrV-1-A39 [Feldmannia irregularis virus a]|uniref:FirrV-1-A39 n=1 Tax=Feldmannia irregularis virus a TaxID=231992 RepID=Q6XM48_9PHYC|nr:FirrV-1-A39 [Feldmannia irregularis virus a]AAR26863.1 FirrV-1-A39 [Feldmannia irregularis virus a]